MSSRAIQAIDSSASAVQEAARAAASVGLVYVSDDAPGIRRERLGKQFQYFASNGAQISEAGELSRIARLAIPPAYENVWICRDEHGHLQATGRDARGRKQYRYHPKWRLVRDDAKFGRMVSFAAALPRLRRTLARDLARPGLPRDKVLAVLVSILDATRVRVGNIEYARDNKSFGLTTLLNRHVSFIRDGRARLNFRGKGGVQHEIIIDDRRIARIVKHCQELPGQQLFQYVTDEGRRAPIDSGQVNDYLRQAMGDDFTAKDFRTWGATLQAVILLARAPLPESSSERAFKLQIASVVKQVAAELRNTPAVCRKSYINPVVFEAWRTGLIRRAFSGGLKLAAPRQTESRVLEFLKKHG